MPHPKGNLKMSGDVHLPDAESDLDLEEGENDLAELGKDRRQPRGAAERVRAAGVLSAGEGRDGASTERAPRQRQSPPRASRSPSPPQRPSSAGSRDPHGLAAAFREPVEHAAGSVAATARANPWAFWGLAVLGVLVVRRLFR